jgi:small subunit ribosomal protein S6
MNFYETVFILDSAPEAIDAEIKKVEDLITANKGELVSVDRWGMRRLAYEIKRKNQGFYTCIYFKGDSSLPATLESQYKLNESCLRYLTVVSIQTPEEILARAKKAETGAPATAPTAEAPAAAAAPITAAAATGVEEPEESPPAEEPEESYPAEEEPAEPAVEEAPQAEEPAEALEEEALEEFAPEEEPTEIPEEEPTAEEEAPEEEAPEEEPQVEEEPTPETEEGPDKKE